MIWPWQSFSSMLRNDISIILRATSKPEATLGRGQPLTYDFTLIIYKAFPMTPRIEFAGAPHLAMPRRDPGSFRLL